MGGVWIGPIGLDHGTSVLDFDQGATFVVPGPPEGLPGLARLERIAGAGKDMGQFDPEFRLLWVQNTKVQF